MSDPQTAQEGSSTATGGEPLTPAQHQKSKDSLDGLEQDDSLANPSATTTSNTGIDVPDIGIAPSPPSKEPSAKKLQDTTSAGSGSLGIEPGQGVIGKSASEQSLQAGVVGRSPSDTSLHAASPPSRPVLLEAASSRTLLTGSVVVDPNEATKATPGGRGGQRARPNVEGQRGARANDYARGLRFRELERQKRSGRQKARMRWKTIRTALRIHAMALVRSKKLETEKAKILATAEEKGIVIDPEHFNEVCLWERGEVTFYSKENLCRRNIAKHDTRLLPVIELWWGLAMTNQLTKSPPGAVPKDEFLAIHRKIYRALIKPFDEAEADESGIDDWNTDAKGEAEMDLYAFQDSLLGIADIWTPTTDGDDYAQFLLHLWDKVTTSRGSRPTWRDDDDIEASDDELLDDGVYDNLFDAVEHENFQEVKRMLIAGYDASEQGKYGLTPLHQACIKGNAAIAMVLLEHGADAEIRDKYGMTPLHHCASTGTTKCTKVLLDRNVDSGAQDGEGHTAYDLARRNGNDNVASLLADNIFRAIRTKNQARVTEFIEENPDTVRHLDPKRNTPLHITAQVGDIGIAKYLYENEADPEALNTHGRTPFWVAVKRGHLELARYLHSIHSDVLELQDCDGITPLMAASDNCDADMVALLIELGCDVSIMDKHGMAALHFAARAGAMECAMALLRAGADVTAKTKSGRTAWTYAKEHKWSKLANLIVPTSGPSIRSVSVELTAKGPAPPNESPEAHCYVTVAGSKLKPVDYVTVNGVKLNKFVETTAESENVSFVVNQWPSATGSNMDADTITITSRGNTSPLFTDGFHFLNKPEIWSVGPNHAEDMEGNVVVRGRNFFGNIVVRIGGLKAANVTVRDATTLSCYVPPSAGTAPRHVMVEVSGVSSTVLEKELPFLANTQPKGERLISDIEQANHLRTQIQHNEPTYITPQTPTTPQTTFRALKGQLLPAEKKALGGGYARWAYEAGRTKNLAQARATHARDVRLKRKSNDTATVSPRGRPPALLDVALNALEKKQQSSRQYTTKSVTSTHMDRCRQERLPPPSSRGRVLRQLVGVAQGTTQGPSQTLTALMTGGHHARTRSTPNPFRFRHNNAAMASQGHHRRNMHSQAPGGGGMGYGEVRLPPI